jgi:hypothetical protein
MYLAALGSFSSAPALWISLAVPVVPKITPVAAEAFKNWRRVIITLRFSKVLPPNLKVGFFATKTGCHPKVN